MKKILLVTLISSFIIACGGGDGGSTANAEKPTPVPIETKEQIELRLNLPAEPKASEVDATILGVDSNTNGVRDELDRKVGFAFPNNEYARKLFTRQAKIWTEMVENQDDISKLRDLIKEKWIMLECTSKLDDTPEIKSFYSEIFGDVYERSKLHYNLKVKAQYRYQNTDQSIIDDYCESFR